MEERIVVCIPVNCQTRQEIMSSMTEIYGTDYLLAETIFLETATQKSCRIYFCDREEKLRQSFEIAGEDQLSLATLVQISNHQQIVYLIFNNPGYKTCLKIASFAKVFLDIGGCALKIESTGIAHQKSKWLEKYNSEDIFDLYLLFVILRGNEEYFYSCGMYNFGKADVSIDATEDINLAIYVMNVFNYYRLTESVILKDEHTFRPDIECPVYKMQWTECVEYESQAIFINPYGRWHLSRN